MPVSLTPIDGGLALEFPFHRELVDGIKSLPYADRRWDAAQRRWIVAHERAPEICRMVRDCLGIVLTVPQAGSAPSTQLRVVRVEYIGRCKPRREDDPVRLWTASGYCDGTWSLVFPDPVLRTWFSAEEPEAVPNKPAGPRTLYQVLTVKTDADQDTIKRAYRQLARQWHPDVCKEPDAHDQFLRIKAAYDVLGDEKTRRKYNAGLALEASQDNFRPFGRPKNMEVHRHDDDAYGYRSPLRCGLLVIQGTARVGQFIVSSILKWEDVIDDRGRTLVSSWPVGGTTFETRWV